MRAILAVVEMYMLREAWCKGYLQVWITWYTLYIGGDMNR